MADFRYERIAAALREDVLDGKLEPGDQIPSEQELAQQFGVSRMTARHAVTQVVREGLVYRVQGKGAFVAQRKIVRDLKSLAGFFEDMRERGLQPGSRVLEVTKRAAKQAECRELATGPGEPVVEVKRLRSVDDEAVGYQVLVVPVDRVPDLTEFDFRRQSFYAHLRQVGLGLRHARQRMEAVDDPTIAKLIGSPENVPFFVLHRVSYAAGDVPVESLTSYFRADRYSYEVELGDRSP